MDPETARLIEERLDRLLAENGPRRAEHDPIPAAEARSALSSLPATKASPTEPAPTEPAPTGPAPAEPASASARSPLGIDPLAGAGSLRRHFTRTHLVILAAIAVIGLVGAGWAVLRARPVPLATAVSTAAPAAPAAPAVTPQPGQGAGPTGRPSPAMLVVHVLGAVKRPGLVELVTGARVQDAIAAAGGLRSNADPRELNLAQQVADGQQIVIGTERRPSGEVRDADGSSAASGGNAPAGAGEVDLNTATPAQLEELPGVGPVTAAKIIAWREEHGRFSRVEELQEVSGIGPKTYAEIAPHCRV